MSVLCCILSLWVLDPIEPLITRADLARALIRFEDAWSQTGREPDEVERVNRAFDAVTLSFFGGRLGEAIGDLERLTASIRGEPEQAELAAWRARLEPPVWVSGSKAPTLKLERLYESSLASPPDVVVRHESGAPEIRLGGEKGHAWTGEPRLPHGRYELHLIQGELSVAAGPWFVVAESLDAVRERNEKQLAELAFRDPPRRQALASTRARNALLRDRPSSSSTTQARMDMTALQVKIAEEIRALAKGENPFRGRAGDTWRVFVHEGREHPLRIHAPAAVAERSAAAPLVIVCHGAGGDENMFFDAYGNGEIRRLADAHGFLVASPSTLSLTRDPEVFDAIVRGLSLDYWIDPKRVFAIGHSMGAGVVADLAVRRSDQIAAAACIAGGGRFSVGQAPTLVLAAELDPLAPPARLGPAARRAAEEGAPVEYRVAEGYGHTIVVGDSLPEVIDWLLQER